MCCDLEANSFKTKNELINKLIKQTDTDINLPKQNYLSHSAVLHSITVNKISMLNIEKISEILGSFGFFRSH